MTSLRQLTAARANGRKSKGPVTPEGKARSASNSLRHGLTAAAQPGPRLAATVCLSVENPEDFHFLHRQCIAEYEPATPGEALLVEELAVNRWRLQRNWLIESTLYENQMDGMTGKLDQEFEGLAPRSRLAFAFSELADKSRSMDLVHRFDARLTRQIERCRTQLEILRVLRQSPPQLTLEIPLLQNEPDPKNEHSIGPDRPVESAPGQPAAPAPEPPQQQAGASELAHPATEPRLRPLVPESGLDGVSGCPQPVDSDERPGLSPSLPRAA